MHGKDVTLRAVSMRFGAFTAVHPTDLKVEAGEFFSILGPSGCGKTTLLRLISGFLQPTSGEISIGGQPMRGVGPNARPTALIFQNLALFPLMPVWQNVAFGLEARGWSRQRRRERAEELLHLVALEGQGEKRPTELSGGQRQRVAVARALAVEPAVLLLDEPLSALDLKLRQHMRAELRKIQRKTGVTFIYITHDQGEALTMSDRIAVMNGGVIEQVDKTEVIYNEPATAFVATFVGEQNVFAGHIAEVGEGFAQVDTPVGRFRGRNRDGLGRGEQAMLFVRPERMRLLDGRSDSSENRLTAVVDHHDLEGAFINLFLRCGEAPITVHLTNHGDGAQSLRGELPLAFRPEDALVLRPGGLSDE